MARSTGERKRQRHATRSRAPSRAEKDGAAPPGDEVRGVRPIWSGTISFGLVSVPVNMFPAVRSSDPVLRMLGPSGTPLQRRYVSAADGHDVAWEGLERGFEAAPGRHVVLTEEELDSVAPRKSRDIDLRRFVPKDSLDPMAFARPYVLTPGGDSTKPYRLLAAAMEREKKVGIATFVMRTKEYLVAILAHDGVLWAETLRFADEIRSPADVGLRDGEKPPARSVAAFTEAIRRLEKKSIGRDQLVESRASRLRALAEKKKEHGEDVVEAAAAEADVASAATEGEDAPDLFATIARSLKLVGAVTPSPRHGPKRAASAPRRRSPPKGRRASRAAAGR